MKNRNEDSFGIIEDDKHKFNSLDEASNYVKDLKGKIERRAAMEEFPVSTAFPEERKKYIEYAISLITKNNLPFVDERKMIRAKAVLSLLARGFTYKGIAYWLKKNVSFSATIEQVKVVEKEGLRMVKDAICKVQNSNVPVVGG